MSVEENKATLLRYVNQVFNHGDVSRLEAFIHENYIVNTGLDMEINGFQGVKDFVAMMRGAFPDFHVTIEHLVAEGDEVAYRARLTGTHQGELFGQPPTGRVISIFENTFIRYKDGKALEAWALADRVGMLKQLGAFPEGVR